MDTWNCTLAVLHGDTWEQAGTERKVSFAKEGNEIFIYVDEHFMGTLNLGKIDYVKDNEQIAVMNLCLGENESGETIDDVHAPGYRLTPNEECGNDGIFVRIADDPA